MQECDVCDQFRSISTLTETADGKTICFQCQMDDCEAAFILANMTKPITMSQNLSSSGGGKRTRTKYQSDRQNYLVFVPK